jgi:hypothetical protein
MYGSCRSCGHSIHEKKTPLPIVYVFGKKSCGFASAAKKLIENAGSCIDSRSVYRDLEAGELMNMRPAFRTSPRVYVDYSHAHSEDVSFDANNFLGGYTELLAFLEPQQVVRDFVDESHGTTMFLVVAADWCGYCEQLQGDLGWTNEQKQGYARYRSKDAVALCITTGENSPLSKVAGVVIKGYPTVLEYSSMTRQWSTLENREVLKQHGPWSNDRTTDPGSLCNCGTNSLQNLRII